MTLINNRQFRNILFSLIFRFGSIICNFLIVPLIITQLSKTEYGILITIISITTWFSFVDFGLANGLKNKISESLVREDILDIQKYISSAYFGLFKVILSLAIILFLFNFYVNWNDLIKAPKSLNSSVNILFFYGLLFFLFRIVAELINPILLAYHKTAISSLLSFIIQFSLLIICFFLKKHNNQSFLHYGLLFFWLPLFFYLITNIYFYSTSFKSIRPSKIFIEKNFEKSLFKLGGNFFVIQIAVLIIFTTDNLIIGRVLGYNEVSNYNIAFRYFNIPLFALSIILMPYWPLFTELYIKKETQRIKKIMNRLLLIWLLLALGVIIMLLFSNYVYNLWIGSAIKIPFILSGGMAAFCIITCWNNIFATFINSTNKLKLQLYSAVMSGLLNIPLSIYLAKYTTLGSAGVILATCTCLISSSFWAPIQYYKLLNYKAKGIWNE